MLQVARLSPKALGESAELVANFLRSQQHSDGGFCNRDGASDLYYTVFALDGLIALQLAPSSNAAARPRRSLGEGGAGFSDRTQHYLRSFRDGAGLDFVHLACLARAWAALSRGLDDVPVDTILARVEDFRVKDGGYSTSADAEFGTAYGAFLALGAYQDLGRSVPDPDRLLASIEALRAGDGAYGNQQLMPEGQTSATAAAIAVRRQLEAGNDASLGPWLIARAHPQGGFLATPATPMPDLLSTATALHALETLQHPYDAVKERCLDFVDSLWTNRGGFYGHWADDHVDCEYTYYGLLALGHLSL
jgi:prenyltransferase beta subunit